MGRKNPKYPKTYVYGRRPADAFHRWLILDKDQPAKLDLPSSANHMNTFFAVTEEVLIEQGWKVADGP